MPQKFSEVLWDQREHMLVGNPMEHQALALDGHLAPVFCVSNGAIWPSGQASDKWKVSHDSVGHILASM